LAGGRGYKISDVHSPYWEPASDAVLLGDFPSLPPLDTTKPTTVTLSPEPGEEQADEKLGSEELSEDEFAILDELIGHGATGERRKLKQREIAMGIGRREDDASLVRTLASMVRRELLESRTGRGAGYFVTPLGQALYKNHVDSSRQKS
jgi:hypothetical protein